MSQLQDAYFLYKTDETQLDGLLTAIRRYSFWMASRRRHVDPEDVAQRTVVAAWSSLTNHDAARSSFRTWIHTITSRIMIDDARAVANRPVFDLFDENAIVVSDNDASSRDFTQLPDEIRQIAIDLASGFSLQDVADGLGITTSALRRRVKRHEQLLTQQICASSV